MFLCDIAQQNHFVKTNKMVKQNLIQNVKLKKVFKRVRLVDVSS